MGLWPARGAGPRGGGGGGPGARAGHLARLASSAKALCTPLIVKIIKGLRDSRRKAWRVMGRYVL